MSFLSTDTIAAVATAPLAAGVAIVRLSGAQAHAAACRVCPSFGSVAPRKAHFGLVIDENGDGIDHAVLIYFKNPHSFTGEDVVEIQCHGGRAVTQAILDAVFAFGVRQAEAGEFSKRAVLNGKMDLTEAEGLADLIAAETAAQRKQALRQLDGELGGFFDVWREKIMHMLAHVEAAVDFPDEELEVLEEAGLKQKLDDVVQGLENALASRAGERLRDGFQVVILGEPNAGKSTLTNLLTGADTAIVSDIAGTTRDVISSHLDLGGYPIILADTAGLRKTTDVIEEEGVKRATARAAQADTTVIVVPAADWPNMPEDAKNHVRSGATLVVMSKVDQSPEMEAPKEIMIDDIACPVVATNLTDHDSLSIITKQLIKIIESRFSQQREAALLTRERHRACVTKALAYLKNAQDLYARESEMSLSDLLAQDLRDAAAEIGKVTGRTGSEDVLDLVFSTFCIGK